MQGVPKRASRVLVTGGAGFLGRYLVREMRSRGVPEVFAPGRKELDLTDQRATAAYFEAVKPDGVIHAAGAVGGLGANVANGGLFSYANTIMGANVLEQARKQRVGQVLIVGTVCMYPAEAPVPVREEALFGGYPAPATAPYGVAKRNLFVMGRAFADQYGMQVVTVIPTNLYGPDDYFEEERSHVVPALIKRFVDAAQVGRQEVVVWGDGTATRDFLFVTDAAAGLIDAFERYRDHQTPLNLGSGRETSIRELAETIAESAGYEGRIEWDSHKPSGAPRRTLDIERIRRVLGFQPVVDLPEGIRRTVEWYVREKEAVA